MSSKINLQTCEYARKSSIFQDNQLISAKYIMKNPGVQHLLHLKSKSKILRPIEIMGFFYEFFCQIQGNNLL